MIGDLNPDERRRSETNAVAHLVGSKWIQSYEAVLDYGTADLIARNEVVSGQSILGVSKE